MMKKLENNIGLGLIICLIGFPQISETIYSPALPAIAKSLSTHVHLVEATLAIYFLGFALGVALWGCTSDWIGRRKTMLIGITIYLMSSLACSLSLSVESLLFWRFIQALGASVGSVITQTMLRDIYDGKKRSEIFSILSGALAFSPAIGPFLGGYISEFAGWRANFWALIVMGVALLIWSFFSLPETKPSHIQSPKIREVKRLALSMFTSRKLWGHIFLIGATNGILFSFYEEAPFVFIEQLGLRPSLYGLLGILIAFGTIVASRISFLSSRRYSEEEMIRAGSYITCLSGLGLTSIQCFGLFSLNMIGFPLFLFFLFVLFIGIGIIIPNSLSLALKDFQNMVGTASSLFGAAYYLQIALATWAMSLLHNGTVWPLPLYLTFLGFILMLGSAMISWKTQKEPSCQTIQPLPSRK